MEEAAQLVEAHALAVMSSSTQRLIMIGDHKQLRPGLITNALQLEAGKGFSHNVSLFECLVTEGAPMHCLQQQHRMRPEIAAPVKCLSYPNLRNGPGTAGREPLLGIDPVRSNHGSVFVLAHQWPEEQERKSAASAANPGSAGTASIVNEQEALMVVAVVQWLLQQGHRLKEIAVLTPYLGQKRLLCSLLRKARVAELADDAATARYRYPVRTHKQPVHIPVPQHQMIIHHSYAVHACYKYIQQLRYTYFDAPTCG
eukprot:jgi/Ulvmu1/4335/UM002_0058.1